MADKLDLILEELAVMRREAATQSDISQLREEIADVRSNIETVAASVSEEFNDQRVRFESINQRFDAQDKRLDSLDERFAERGKELRELFVLHEHMDAKLDALAPVIDILPELAVRTGNLEEGKDTTDLQLGVVVPALKKHSGEIRELQEELRHHRAHGHAA